MKHTEFKEQCAAYASRCELALITAADIFLRKGSKVSQAAIYSLLGGGKHVRATLSLAVCDMLGGDASAAMNFATAIEMTHTFSLIHDDLPCMDDDDMRRGKPSCHIAFGEANALLAGDALMIAAFAAIANAPCDAQLCMHAAQLLAQGAGAQGMIYGQELDIRFETEAPDRQQLHEVHLHKTGALIKTAALLGVVAAGQLPQQNDAVRRYAENLGLVFQIVDDILDVSANEEALGKPLGSDAISGKTTFVTMFGAKAAREEAERLTSIAIEAIREAYGDKSEFLSRYAQDLLQRIC